MLQVHDKLFEILIPQIDIELKIKQLAKKIAIDYREKKPIFLAVLNGSFMFAAELFKNISINAEISFLRVQSYSNLNSAGQIKEILGLNENIENRDIIILEDIVDTGLTINELLQYLKAKNPKSIAIASLLFKPKALLKNVNVDYFGFEIEPQFVIGYGLDYNGLGRNYSDIYVLME